MCLNSAQTLSEIEQYSAGVTKGGDGRTAPGDTIKGVTPVLYQVLNKQVPVPLPVPVVQVPVQVPVPNLQVPVPVPVLCINYRHSVTLQLHKVKVVVFFIFKESNS